jgi:hypothetical protein
VDTGRVDSLQINIRRLGLVRCAGRQHQAEQGQETTPP